MFTFLGTSAGAQYPGVWCTCRNCNQARTLGGRNIRRNSCAAIGDHTLIDFGPSIPIQTDQQGLSLHTFDTLLVTHAHDDHFFPWYLRWRFFSPDKQGDLLAPPLPLTIYGSERVKELTLNAIKQDPDNHHLEIKVVELWQPVKTKHLVFTPVLANHDFRQDCFNFIIEYKGKTILYALDTAWFLPETMEFLKQYKLDLVVMEGTLGFKDDHDFMVPGHCNFIANRQAREWLLSENIISESTVFAVSHIGHEAPPHDECAPLIEKWGLTLAYDGMQLPLSEDDA